MINIDVCNLSPEHQTLFIKLIRTMEARGVGVLFSSNSYWIPEEIQLSHSIIVNPEYDNEGCVHCYVVNQDRIGEGSDGQVHSILTSYRITFDDHLIQKSLDSSLVVKIEKKICMTSAHRQRRVFAHTQEVNNLKDLHHTGFTLNVSQHDENHFISAIIMQKQPGAELFDLMAQMMQMEYVSSQFCFMCSLAILEAYERQLYHYQRIHGDVKPENIMVDLGIPFKEGNLPVLDEQFVPPCLNVNFIDYAGARKWNDPHAKPFSGTFMYNPPEVEARLLDIEYYQNEKADIYSLGKILWLLWGMNLHFDVGANEFNQRAAYQLLFESHDDSLTYLLFKQIYYGIMQMQAHKQQDRPTLPEALECLRRLNTQNNENTLHLIDDELLKIDENTMEPSPVACSEFHPTPALPGSPKAFNL